MTSLETAPHESHIAPDVEGKIRQLLDGPPSNNYNFRQLQLIVEKFVVAHPEEILDHQKLDELIMEWADSKMSGAFKKIVYNQGFKTHPRFLGDISKVTLEDVECYAETEMMPEV